jgi:tRNA(fMet)-specific endonuclease VapC
MGDRRGARVAELILDTAVLINIERGRLAPEDIWSDDDDVAIAAVTAAELWLGAELADAVNRPPREAFVQWMLGLLTVEDYDLKVARVHGRLIAANRRAGRTRGAHDMIIAATAAARDRILLTPNKGFAELPGVRVRVVG